jgi:integrase
MLHKALDDAVRYNLLARNVCDAVSPPRRRHYEIQPLSMEQAQQFLTIAKGHSLEALFVLAITTGMRRGEILALKSQDINFSQTHSRFDAFSHAGQATDTSKLSRKPRRVGGAFCSHQSSSPCSSSIACAS